MRNIEYAKARSDEEIMNELGDLMRGWYKKKFGGKFTDAQKHAIVQIKHRKSILVSSPTGSGKTLCAFTSILDYLMGLAEKDELEDKVYAVYISPLKALGNDVYVNLIKPLEEVEKILGKELGIRVGVRTGDTTAYEKQKMLKKAPHILITTPESLAIVLNTPKFIEYMKGVEFCVVDEIHALDNKRGVHLSLSLERLQEISVFPMVRIGLSATIAPLEEIAMFLTGNRNCLIADVKFHKKINVDVVTPVDLIDTTGFEMHDKLYKLIDKQIQNHKTTLIFTNTRSATERVIHHLKTMFPKSYVDEIGAHHSSLSKEHRFDMEQRLREGKLKVVVTSTSLELGIDIGDIDLVLLLGSPKGTARALQRCLNYESEVLCEDGRYMKIGEIVEKKIDVKIVSYKQNKGFVKNKIRIFHKYPNKKIINIKLKCGEEIKCTEEHPVLTKGGWKKGREINTGDLVAEIRHKIEFQDKSPYLYELLPKDKIFVVNKDNFFQKNIDELRRKKRISMREFVKEFGIDYNRFTDIRRLRGRKKSIRLDYFLKMCELCGISEEKYLPYLKELKTKGKYWPKMPLKLTREIMWLAGIIATDGCIVKTQKKGDAEYYKIKIGNKSKVLIDKVNEIVRGFKIKPYINLKEGIYHLEFGSNLFAYLFMSLGILCKRKTYEIKINNNVFSLPAKLIYSYLGGIFEGDGNLQIVKEKNHGMIRIFTASQDFALGIHRLLLRLGHSNKISKSKIKSSKLIKKVSGLDLYCVGMFRKEDLKGFFEKIDGFGEKARRGKKITKNFGGYLSLKDEYNSYLSYSEVESIKFENAEVVYNLTLENEPNNFIVGNVIVHNCGRAGHRLHEVTKGKFVILDRDDLIESSVIMKNIVERKMDKVHIPKNCLDVLSQHIFGMAIYKIWNVDEMFSIIKKSYCYAELSKKDFLEVISYLKGDYALEARNVYAKIWYDEETKEIGKRGMLARVIYMTNIGTIPDEAFVNVKVPANDGKIVGKVDEEFVGRLKKGDVFVLGGHKYQYLYTRGMNIYVRADVSKSPTIPSWFSEMLPLSFDLALEINRFRRLIKERFDSKISKTEIIKFIQEFLYCNKEVAYEIWDYMRQQYQYIGIPNIGEIIIERYRAEKDYFVFHSLFGRMVNDALSRAIGFLIGRLGGRDVEIGICDNGFYLSGEKLDNSKIDKALKYLTIENIEEVLKEAIEKTEVLKRRFRHCATRSLMILKTYKGRRKSVGKQQMGTHFLISAVKKLDNNFPILNEARREVLEDLMDIKNAKLVLSWIKEGRIKIKKVETHIPSPFSLNLVMQAHSDLIKMEDRVEFLKRIYKSIESRIKDK